MPADILGGYRDFRAHVQSVIKPMFVEVGVDSSLNGGANLFISYSGTIVIDRLYVGGQAVYGTINKPPVAWSMEPIPIP